MHFVIQWLEEGARGYATGSRRAAARTEHYEIAAYQGFIAMARALGERDAVPLLEENLKQERNALREVEKVSRRLARDGAKEQESTSRRRTTARTSR